MRICYLDESGTPELSAQTTHFVFLGLSIPASSWKNKDAEITAIKRRYQLQGREIHTAWIARRYQEQEVIPAFQDLTYDERRTAVRTERDTRLTRRAAIRGLEQVSTLRKNFTKTDAYIHLTHTERHSLLSELADAVNGWDDCRLFAEATDKTAFGRVLPATPPFEEGFTQVVSRFHRYLEAEQQTGLLVQDNNPTVSRRLTDLTRRFHEEGTRWTSLPRIVETPLFVDSQLTSLVQMSDLCAYATRRYLENGERTLFDKISSRFHRVGGRMVGARHYVGPRRRCNCEFCRQH